MDGNDGRITVSHPETGLEKRVPEVWGPTYAARGWNVGPATGGEPSPDDGASEPHPSDQAGGPPAGPAGSVAAPKLVPIRIDVNERGTSIEVAGQEIAPHVGAYALEAQAGRPPMLTLYGMPDGTIAADGIVVAVHDREEREALAAFLDAIDPAELERLVLEDPEFDNAPHATMRAALRVLRRLATG